MKTSHANRAAWSIAVGLLALAPTLASASGDARLPPHAPALRLTSDLAVDVPAEGALVVAAVADDLSARLLAAGPAATSPPAPPTRALPTAPGIPPQERAALEERLASNESWRTVGKIFTWIGIGAGGLGLLMMASGAAAAWSGAFNLSFGEFAGGAVTFNFGVILGLSGLVVLAVGIPLWAINAGRASRLRRLLDRGRPTVRYDPRTGATVVGWALSF